MLVAFDVAVRLPLLELSPGADLVAQEPRLDCGDAAREIIVDAKRLRGGENRAEEFADDLLVVRDAVLARAVFGAPPEEAYCSPPRPRPDGGPGPGTGRLEEIRVRCEEGCRA